MIGRDLAQELRTLGLSDEQANKVIEWTESLPILLTTSYTAVSIKKGTVIVEPNNIPRNGYAVVVSSGSWDGYTKWVHSVHLTEDEAVKERDRVTAEMKERLEHINGSVPSYAIIDEDGDLDNEDDLTAEQVNDFYRWWWKRRDILEWNGAVVKAYEIGKVYDSKHYTIDDLTTGTGI